MFKIIISIFLLHCLTSCANNQFKSSIKGFDESTAAAVKVQKERLSSFSTSHTERISLKLAEEKVDLRIKDCAQLVTPATDVSNCRLIRFDNKILETPFRAENILALGWALEDYADSLSKLAADASDDADAFSKSLSELSISIGKLDAEIEKTSGSKTTDPARLGAFASIVAEIGNLYFEYQRIAALKKIIIKSNPFVQDAADLLANAYDALRLDTMTVAFEQLQKVATEQIEAVNAAETTIAEIRQKQNALVTELASFKQKAAERNSFIFLASAHDALAKASADESREALQIAILRIIESAKNIKAATETLDN